MWHRTNTGGGRIEHPEGELIRECEAFLAGRLARDAALHDQPVPAWMWCNMLAHGSGQQLRWVAAGGLAGAFAGSGPWERGLCFLARELLATADERAVPVEELQRQVLVPLELEMTRDLGWVETGPGLFVMRVVAALASCRGDRAG